MRKGLVRFWLSAVLLAGLLAGLLSVFSACQPAPPTDPVVAFNASLKDAEITLPEEVSRSLTAIVPWNTSLVWQKGPGSRVLVTTWAGSDKYYQGWEGKDDYKLTANLWVNVAPEAKDWFLNRPYSALRLEQLIGLKPNTGKTKIIELWVDPKDLFRPSPDPEITDHEAELDFPANNLRAFNNDLLLKDDYDVDAAGNNRFNPYPTWFNNLRRNSYQGQYALPWTRLGYTYDWGSSSHFGLSEYIVAGGVKGGITVGIKSITDTAAYFQR
jgi:hypothetical protein